MKKRSDSDVLKMAVEEECESSAFVKEGCLATGGGRYISRDGNTEDLEGELTAYLARGVAANSREDSKCHGRQFRASKSKHKIEPFFLNGKALKNHNLIFVFICFINTPIALNIKIK